MATTSSSPQHSCATAEEYVEDVVCKTTDLVENEPKVFDLKDGKVLLIKQNGQINALGTKCTHYGAPLEKSAVGDGRLRCQWHGACFNITTGDIEDFPGMDSLPCYQVILEDDNVKVRAKKSELKANKRVKPMVKLNPTECQKIVVIGGGPAGAVCAETLRQEGFRGKLTLVSKEKYLPYDRIKLSKALDISDINNIQLRSPSFYKDGDIDVITNVMATEVNPSKKTVTLSDAQILPYDKVFVATGSTPRLPDLPGANFKNIFVLREFEDVKLIASHISPDNEAVILGSGFIGMECAAFLAGKVKKVSVIGRGRVPFGATFGEKIGTALMRLFVEKGIEFHMDVEVKQFVGNEGKELKGVELADGTVIPANFCITGIGSNLNTQFLGSSGININPNGTVEVDEYLKTNIDDIFAGGDIANAPIITHNTKASIGHWGLSHYHGRLAALNMLGKNQPLKTIPFFWTMLFGKSIRYAGYGKPDDILYTGNVDELKFVAFYLNRDEVIAVSSCQMDPVVSQFAELMIQGKKLTRKDLQADPLAWTKQEL
ncbi:apoptosis-inducing factor 3 isoform X4 [Agrilus planipennis]|nr:apoptosis-inducing factor 3 isoform X3 [Agrilus planipennis]XP_025833523.1 apoptosis-inducing factor 3 isoform X4 [Agrilus planipennis]